MDINLIQKEIENDLAGVVSAQALEDVRVKYLGRKGLVAQLTNSISTLAPEERREFGKEVNALKNEIAARINEKEKSLKIQGNVFQKSDLDIGLPGIWRDLGSCHPITRIID